MEALLEYLPIILPLFIIDVILAIISLIHVWKHQQYRFGNKWIWTIVVAFVQLFGPIIYFAFGRGED